MGKTRRRWNAMFDFTVEGGEKARKRIILAEREQAEVKAENKDIERAYGVAVR
jgi:hypothetical protein